MIERASKLKVRDNSGGKLIKVIKINNYFGRQKGFVGDFILGNVQELRKKRKDKAKVKIKQMVQCLLISSAAIRQRKDGSSIKFDDNAVCLLNRNKKLLSSRVFGSINKDIRKTKYFRILLLAKGSF